MRDFFKQMLEELEFRTGIRQIHWMRQNATDQEDFDKKKTILLDSMIIASKKFDYIPEEDQKRIILKMIIEDQNYESMTSREVWRWLDQHKNGYFTYSKFSESELTQEPATDEQVAGYVKQFMDNISKIGQPEFKNGMKDLRHKAGFESGLSVVNPRPEFTVGDPCNLCGGKGYIESNFVDGEALNKESCDICEMTGKINRALVHAISQEEADKSYLAFKLQK